MILPNEAIPFVAAAGFIAACFAIGAAITLYDKWLLEPNGWPEKELWWGFGGFITIIVVAGLGTFCVTVEILGAVVGLLFGAPVLR